MKKFITSFCLILLGTFLALQLQGKLNDQSIHENKTRITITKIVDGDTFWAIDQSEENKKYRLIGIDAPETSNRNKKTANPYSKIATNALANFLKDSIAYISFDRSKVDQYKRSLVYLYNSKNQFINYELVRNGHATVLTIKPNISFQSQFEAAQDSAKMEQKGIWAP